MGKKPIHEIISVIFKALTLNIPHTDYILGGILTENELHTGIKYLSRMDAGMQLAINYKGFYILVVISWQ